MNARYHLPDSGSTAVRMIRLVLGVLMVGPVGCAGAVASKTFAPNDVPPETVAPGRVEPEAAPVTSVALSLWVRPLVVVSGIAAEDLFRPPVWLERRVLSAAGGLRCAAGGLEDDPRLPASLRVDLSIGATGAVVSLEPRGARPFAWPCLQRVLGSIRFDAPEGGKVNLALALFFRPSSLSWGHSPALRPMFPPRERNDAPREPHEIAFDQDASEFLWSLGQLRARGAPMKKPTSALEQLLAQQRAAEIDEPSAGAIATATRLAEQDPNPTTRATARLLLARMHHGNPEAARRALLALVCPGAPEPSPERSPLYWEKWRTLHPSRASLHPTPKARREWAQARAKDRRPREKTPSDEPSSLDEATIFLDPFDRCTPTEGATKEILAEAWAELGNLHELEDANTGSVFAPNLAASAFARSLALVSDDAVRLRLALRHERNGRYRAAAALLSGLLVAREQAQGEGAMLRAIALPALAHAMLHPDFDGPPGREPFVPAEHDPFSPAIDLVPGETFPTWPLGALALARVQDPALVPPGVWFTQPLLLAMGQRLKDFGYLEDAEQIHEHQIATAPLHREAPKAMAALIQVRRKQSVLAAPNSPAQAEALRQQAAAEKRFQSAFVDSHSPWSLAHRDDSAALELVKKLASELANGSW